MAIAGLTFRPAAAAVAPVELAGGVELRGEVEWIAEGDEGAVAALLAAVGTLGRKVGQGAFLRFGNAVGTFDLGARGAVRVRCGKWGEAEFDALLADLARRVLALPFSSTQAAGIPHDRSIADRDDVLLHAFLYARQVVIGHEGRGALIRALELVVRDPHRRFEAERTRIGLAHARHVDARTVARIAMGADGVERAPASLEGMALARALRGHVPVAVDVRQVEHSLDTAENRFVLEVLRQVRAIVERVEVIARERAVRAPFWGRTLRDCDAMRRALAPFERHPMWIDVGRMVHVPLGSSVLQRRRGYKDVLGHHLALRAAVRIPLDPDRLASNLLGLKDVATLYELWCFFAVVDVVRDCLGREPDSVVEVKVSTDLVGIKRGLEVSWDGGPTVHYNPTFRRGAKAPWTSASQRLRPDVVLEILREGRHELHVFDAKLRVQGKALVGAEAPDDDAEDDADDEAPSSNAGERTYKNDDVVKMHAYRDALPHVRSARVLYPGTVREDFPSLEPGAHPLDGVGTVPLVPDAPAKALRDLITSLLANPIPRSIEMAPSRTPTPTPAGLLAVAAMADAIESAEATPVPWGGGERDASGSIQMRYPEYPPVLGHLLQALEINHVLLHDFDWQAWGAEAVRFQEPAVLAAATLTQVRRLLTLHARTERFVDGHLAEVLARGHMSALLRRLAALAGEDMKAG